MDKVAPQVIGDAVNAPVVQDYVYYSIGNLAKKVNFSRSWLYEKKEEWLKEIYGDTGKTICKKINGELQWLRDWVSAHPKNSQ